MTGTSPVDPAAVNAFVEQDVSEDTTLPAEPKPELLQLGRLLLQGLNHITALSACLETLDDLMVTGRPPAIADAATAVELSLSAAEPVFSVVCKTLDSLGSVRLQDAADRLRQVDQMEAAAAAESLHAALRRFVRRNVAYHRRAQGLGRGLAASLRAMHALGMAGNGRLLAEA